MTCRTRLIRTGSSTAIAAALMAGSAFADVTGAQVWADWKSYMEGLGYAVEGTEEQSGSTLTVSDVSMTYDSDEADVVVSMPNIAFTDNDDGTVTVDLPTSMPISFDMTPPEGEAVKGRVTYAQTAPTMIVSGDPEDMTYTYSAETVDMTLDEFEADGEAMTSDMLSMSASIRDVASVNRMQIGELRNYTQDISAAELTYDVSFVVPEEEGGGTGSLSGSMQNLELNATGDLPLDSGTAAGTGDMDALLAAGLNVDGSFSYAAGRTDIDMQPPEGPLVGTTSSDGGTIEIAMGADGLRYDVSQTNLSVNFEQVPDLPFPISLQMARSAFNFAMPVKESEEPQDFAFGLTLGEFTFADAIWNLFDPAGQLPRDPATISVDLTGEAKMLVNIMDPAATEALGPEAAPGELHALDINEVLVSALGARLTGSGGFTFDNSDTVTFNGMPKPLGSVDIRLEGANALLDKLVQMGLLPEDQAMGARMMMGLFGVPQGEDVLTSTIEVNEQGQVLANGQRLQ